MEGSPTLAQKMPKYLVLNQNLKQIGGTGLVSKNFPLFYVFKRRSEVESKVNRDFWNFFQINLAVF